MANYPNVLANVYRVRTALAPLLGEGLLESQNGSGTWVRQLPPRTDANMAVREQLIEEILTELAVLHAKIETLRALS
jgi:DNA-binding GntR family transcriptional regulator